jgi:hypothetical protein
VCEQKYCSWQVAVAAKNSRMEVVRAVGDNPVPWGYLCHQLMLPSHRHIFGWGWVESLGLSLAYCHPHQSWPPMTMLQACMKEMEKWVERTESQVRQIEARIHEQLP